jgi:hypothetical protein
MPLRSVIPVNAGSDLTVHVDPKSVTTKGDAWLSVPTALHTVLEVHETPVMFWITLPDPTYGENVTVLHVDPERVSASPY